MGQYYHPIEITSNEWVYSHDYGNGLKLMEHSYIGNNFVGVVMKLLSKGGKWYKKPLVWCGDYYGESKSDTGVISNEGEETWHEKCTDDKKINPSAFDFMSEIQQMSSVIVNHTKKEYVILSEEYFNEATRDKAKAQQMIKVIEEANGDYEWSIHPLPLLTALGNGRGGGDYHGINEDMVGYWARDVLSVESKIPEGYKKLNVEFKE